MKLLFKMDFLVISLGICLLSLGCAGRPPVDEIAAARVALQAARDAQAQVYVEQEYRTAEQTLQQAEKEFSLKEYDRALRLSRIASLQANYALALTKWKIKANQLEQANGELQRAIAAAEQARVALEEVKKQIQ
jgi:predicted S18 family serine protease